MGKTRGVRKDRDNGCDETKLYLQEPCLERKIPESELNYITEIPEGLESKEWLALHTIGFFEHINLIYGTISEFCTSTSCPDMLGPGPRSYLWMDDRGKKSKVSAPQYVDFVMTFIQKTVNDETMFPTKHGNEFPANFQDIIKKVHRLLFHVIAHIYHSHFREVVLLGLHAHLNSLFIHVIEFNIQHNTIENKETEVLQDLIHALKIIQSDNESSTADKSESVADNELAGEAAAGAAAESAIIDSTGVEDNTEGDGKETEHTDKDPPVPAVSDNINSSKECSDSDGINNQTQDQHNASQTTEDGGDGSSEQKTDSTTASGD